MSLLVLKINNMLNATNKIRSARMDFTFFSLMRNYLVTVIAGNPSSVVGADTVTLPVPDESTEIL